MSLESLKLNKQLLTGCQEAGFINPKEVQTKCLNRFEGGQDWVVVGPEGCGKTTTYVLSVLKRLKYAKGQSPRALILVPNKEKVYEVMDCFDLVGKNINLRYAAIYPGTSMQDQRDDLFDGIDVVIGTPDRLTTIYSQSGLSVGEIKMFIIDDAEQMIKQGFQAQIYRLVEGMPKCQKLSFSEVYHDKLDRLINANLHSQGIIEINPEVESSNELFPQGLYNVLNYKTKLNLLNLVCQADDYEKLVVFSQTRLTAGQLYNSVSKRMPGTVAMLKPLFYNQQGVEYVEEFLENSDLKILFVANEDGVDAVNTAMIPYFLHFDVPEDLSVIISRTSFPEDRVTFPRAEIFATDIELALIKKLENQHGAPIEVLDTPLGLVVDNNRKRKPKEEGSKKVVQPVKETKVNMGSKDKIKKFGKVRKKRGKHDL